MWVSTFIRRHIFRLPKNQPFTTRDCLIYGVRSAVDQALYRLVKSGTIRRLARGIFVRDQKKCFTVFEIANIKAAAFGHKIMRHDFVIPSEVNNLATAIIEPKLFINSRSSQFCVDGKVIRIHGTPDRKMKLDGGKAGQALTALWKMGRDNVNLDAIRLATSGFTRTDRQEIIHYMKWLPAWLGDYFIKRDRWPFPLRNSSSPWPTVEPKLLVRLL